ncbi:MAG: DUF2723 domain-containing protein [Anaerolineae bacterium]|nr:DUF2723 domain-containing protein [Anaerolineae bacterium]
MGSHGRGTQGRTPLGDALLSLTVGLGALALFLPTVATGVLEGDPGEFQMAAAIGGLAHPTGYPLYLTIGWLWARVAPIGSPAHALNLLSALFGAAAVGLTCLVVLALASRSPWWAAWPAGVSAGLALSASPTFWSQSIVAEVYSLHALLLAGLVLLGLRYTHQPGRWWVIGLLLGLGLAHHRMTLLYLPPTLLALALARPPRPARSDIARAALAAFLPLLFYAYLPLRASHTPYLHLELAPGDELILYRNDLAGFLTFVSGQPFGTAVTLVGLPARAQEAVGWAAAELSLLVWALALAGVIWLMRHRREAAVLLAGSFALNVAFNLVYSIGDIRVFYLPVYQIGAILAGTAIASSALARGHRIVAPLLAGVVVIVVLFRLPGARALALASVPEPPADRWPAVLDRAPRGAILLSNDRNEIVPLWYHQYVLGARPDLLGLFPLISPEPPYAHIGALAHRVLPTGREVYLIKDMPGLEVGFQLEPATPPLVRVLGPWQMNPAAADSQHLSQELELLGWEAPAQAVVPGEEVTVVLYWRPLEALSYPYSSYIHVLDAEGRPAWPGSDHRPGGVYYPADLWVPGQVIRDEHHLAVPEDAPPGTYRLLAGMYEYPSLQTYGRALDLGPLEIRPPKD